MYRILEILIEDFENQKPGEAYQLAQYKFCENEKAFMDSLSAEQKKAYLALSNAQCSLKGIMFDNFAMYVFENLRKFF